MPVRAGAPPPARATSEQCRPGEPHSRPFETTFRTISCIANILQPIEISRVPSLLTLPFAACFSPFVHCGGPLAALRLGLAPLKGIA